MYKLNNTTRNAWREILLTCSSVSSLIASNTDAMMKPTSVIAVMAKKTTNVDIGILSTQHRLALSVHRQHVYELKQIAVYTSNTQLDAWQSPAWVRPTRSLAGFYRKWILTIARPPQSHDASSCQVSAQSSDTRLSYCDFTDSPRGCLNSTTDRRDGW